MEGARIGIQYETSFAGKTEVTKFHSFPEVQLSVSEQKIKLKTVFEVVVLYYHFFPHCPLLYHPVLIVF